MNTFRDVWFSMGTDGFRGVKAGAFEGSVAASELVYEFRLAFVECYNWSIVRLLEISQAVFADTFADVQGTGRDHTVLHDPTESRMQHLPDPN